MAGKRTAFFGELLVRLSVPGHRLLSHADSLDLHVGGAEANVAIGMAALGSSVRMVSCVPDNALGSRAIAALGAVGADCAYVHRAPGRMGLYFLSPGVGLRSGEIVYDRAASSFALATPDDFDFARAFAGCQRLHISGINPALGPQSAELALAAVRSAKAQGLEISFDGNYRANLWSAWDSNPRAILSEFVRAADIFFGNHRDIALLLDREFDGTDGPARRRVAAEAAFAAFPNLKFIASTARHVERADAHRLAARVDTPQTFAQTKEVLLSGIVDRIGAGDAFAAGVLFALDEDLPLADVAQHGLALACLKHSLAGDASLFGRADVAAYLNGQGDVRR